VSEKAKLIRGDPPKNCAKKKGEPPKNQPFKKMIASVSKYENKKV